MPIMRCQKDGKPGWKWGENGVCFTGPNARARARAVGAAIHAQGGDKGNAMSDIETKVIGGHVLEVKQEERNGVPVGIVAGHIATWSPDSSAGRFGKPDRFVRGAFSESIMEHRNRNNRQVRLKDHHGRTVGGFPIDTVVEDAVGLFGRGEVNLETQLGREAFSLAKQGVIVDFSVGFTAVDDRLTDDERVIFKALLWEGSMVDEPLNRAAQITEVKSVRLFRDLPIATGKVDIPEPTADNCLLGTQYPIIAVIEGKSMVVPDALDLAAKGIKDDEEIDDELKAAAILHLEKYYAKMDKPSPFDPEQRQFFGVNDVKKFSKKDLERILVESGKFSQKAALTLASKMSLPNDALSDLLRDIRSIKV